MPNAAPHTSILVVAPNAELRHSLAFLLNAEGFDVETRDGWRSGDDTGSSEAMIMDHRSLPRGFLDNGVLGRLGRRLILLASHALLPVGLEQATLIQKPLLDQELINALQMVLAARA